MRAVGVRELKASLSELLRAAGRGERIRVMVRGRPVADLVPPAVDQADVRRRALIAQQRLSPASRSRPDAAPPLAPADRPASAVVLADRGAER